MTINPMPLLSSVFGLGHTTGALIAVGASVLVLTLLVAAGRMPPILGFVVAAVVGAILLGLPMRSVSTSIEKGIGDLIGSLIVLVCLGAVFGKLIADSGAAQKVAASLIGLFGPKRLPLALTLTGFIVGIPLYYNVGFVLLVPLIFSLVYQSGRPAVATAIPLLCGLSIAHGFLPPHPSPTALVGQFHADLGLTLIYGLVVAVPTLLIAGPIFALSLKSIEARPAEVFRAAPKSDVELPGAWASFATALLPAVLLAAATALQLLFADNAQLKPVLAVIADPTLVLLASFAFAIAVLGVGRGIRFPVIMKGSEQALRDIAPILLIIAGAGALKQVFVASGVDILLGAEFGRLPVPPLVLGWLIAATIRICLGSATVAGLTAAGIIAPLVHVSGVSPNLMVLSLGAGSLMCSHVNDSGFWMFKEYFNLSLKDTFRSWSLMETLVGVFGLIFVLALSVFVH